MGRRLCLGLIALCLALGACVPIHPPQPTATPTQAVPVAAPGTRAPVPTRSPVPPMETPQPARNATATPSPSTVARSSPTATPFGLVAIPNATVVYYDIGGSTAQELRAQMNALGPADQIGGRWDAYATWTFWWNWPARADGACDLAKATVTCDLKVTFPRWQPGKDAPADLVARWASYARALAEHESGHIQYAAAKTTEVQEAMQAASCGTANEAAQSVLDGIRRHDSQYDEETGHGATQGAVFP